MKIATIILNYNSSADCKRCIADLLQQEDVEQEIIVVDNCSRTEERDAAEGFCKKNGTTFIANAINSGYNAGNNVGLRYAAEKGYEYALIANPDMQFPQRDYLKKLITPMLNDNEIVVCGSDIVTPEGVHQNPKQRGKDCLRGYFQWIKDFITLKRKRNANNPDWIEDPATSKECRCLNGCCFFINLGFAKEIGFFDEGTFLYGEEPILGAIVEENKKKMFYNATTFAIHNHQKSNEGNRLFCLKHWRHSMLHSLHRYSKIAWWKKIIAQASIELYFLTLKLSYFIKRQK